MAFVLRWGRRLARAFRQELFARLPLLRTLPNNNSRQPDVPHGRGHPSLLGVNGLALQDERAGQVAIDGARWRYGAPWGVGKMNVGWRGT